MVAYFYTKPLQGKLFRLLSNMITNLGDTNIERFQNSESLSVLQDKNQSNQTDVNFHDVLSKESVGKTIQTRIRNAGMDR